MGETVIEKIIRNNVGKTVKPGDIVTVNVDRVMIHDIFIPFVAEKFEEMGFTKLWDPDKAVLIYDHLVPASQLDDTRHFHAGDAFARKYGMKNVHRSDGICHQLMTEAGYVKPGNIVTVNVDRVMIHDIFIPFVKEKFEEMGFTKIWDPDKAVLIYDHLVPASQVDDTRHFRIGNEFV